jgi:hypothetical protein
MAMNMTPCEIEFMLHCYYSPEPHPRYYAPAITEAARRLTKEGLIKYDDCIEYGRPIYKATEKGKFYVKILCETPFPELRYVDPRENGRSI